MAQDVGFRAHRHIISTTTKM